MILYSQIDQIIEYLTEYPINIENYLKHVGEHFYLPVNNTEEIDDAKKKKHFFMQMILHANELGGNKVEDTNICYALEIFLRSRNTYKATKHYENV